MWSSLSAPREKTNETKGKKRKKKLLKRRKRKSSSCPGSFTFCCKFCVFLTLSLVPHRLHVVRYGAPCWLHHHHHHSAAPSAEEQRNDFVFPDVPPEESDTKRPPLLVSFSVPPGFPPQALVRGRLIGPGRLRPHHTWTPLPWRCSI